MPHPQIEAGHKTLREIFLDDKYRFEIPSYQRPYSWTEKEVQELVDDLREAIEEERQDYFLGSFVLVKAPGSKQAEVVDGQQRLTTLSILFAVLRDLASDPQIRDYLDQFVTIGRDPIRPTTSGEALLRVRDKPRERDWFKKIIQAVGATENPPELSLDTSESIKLYKNNAVKLRRQLERWTEEQRTDLIAYLRDNCLVVVVEVASAADARRIFQVLNARGLDLQATDILKARSMDQLTGDTAEDYANLWESHENDIGRSSFAQLFAHIRMIYAQRKSKTALEDHFEKDVPLFVDDPQAFMDTVLSPIVTAYVNCHDHVKAQKAYGHGAASLLRALRRIDNSDWVPPVLAFLNKFDDQTAFEKFLVKFERLSAFLFITRARANERINRSAAVLYVIEQAETPEQILDDPALDLKKKERKAFKDALDGDLYQSTRVRMPVMMRLEEAMRDGPVVFDGRETIEHVLPRTMSDDWAKNFSEDTQGDWLHHIANLVLLSRKKNSQANNKAFADKKTGYFSDKNGKTMYAVTQDVLEYDDWTLESLEQRREKVLDRLHKVWQLS